MAARLTLSIVGDDGIVHEVVFETASDLVWGEAGGITVVPPRPAGPDAPQPELPLLGSTEEEGAPT